MEETRTIVLDIYDYKLIINALNEFRNKKIAENVDTEIIDELMEEIDIEDRKKIDIEYLKELVSGVLDNIHDIDSRIEKYLENWNLERLGLTDQAIIRIAVYELLYTDTPDLVCINEAIELSKKYSDEKVSKMINGVLDKIYHERLDNE